MKNRILAMGLAVMLTFSMSACGSSTPENASSSTSESTVVEESKSKVEETATEEEPEVVVEEPEEEKIEDSEEYKELAALGDVEVEDGLISVKITVPADIVGEVTQEELDETVGEVCLAAKLNDDGSVTYKLTKAQHQEMLNGIKTGIDEGIKSLIDDKENYSISGVTYNDDLTEFKVTIDGDQIGIGDYFSTMLFYMYGGMYGIFTGHQADNIKVEFLDTDGNVIETANSSEME